MRGPGRVVDRSVARSLAHARPSFSSRTAERTGRCAGTRLTTNANSANDVDKLNSLQLWLEGLGSDFDACGVRLKRDDDDGFGVRGVAHGKSIARGSELVRVPREAFITAEVARSRLESLLFQQNDEKKSCAHELSDFQCLELFLLCEKNIGGDSSWEPYLSSLPDMLEHPMLWHDFSILRRETQVGYHLLERIDACRRDFEAFQTLQWSSGVKPKITEVDVRWATAILTSRAFHLSLAESDDDFDDGAEFLAKFNDLDEDVWEPAGDDENYSDGEMVLVPWADALNHSSEAGAQSVLTYSSSQRVALLAAHRDYEEGAQVFDSYGVNISATDCFINYGFVDTLSHQTDLLEFPGDVFLAAATARGLKVATENVDFFAAIKIEETIFQLDPSTGINEDTLFHVSEYFEEDSVDDSTILEIFRQLCSNKELALTAIVSSREDVGIPPRHGSLTGRPALDYVLRLEHDAVRTLCTKIDEQLVAQSP